MKPWPLLLLLLVATGCSVPGRHDAASSLVFVSDERGDAIVVLDSARGVVVGRYGPLRRPRGLRLSPDGRTLYVAVSGTPIGGPGVDEKTLPPPDPSRDGVAVIDTKSGRIDRVLRAGPDPETFALSPDGRTLFVANESAGAVSMISLEAGRSIRSVPVGDEPEGTAVTPDGARLFVACEASDHVAVLDAHSLERLATIPLSGRPRGALASRDGRNVYISVETAGMLAVLPASGAGPVRMIDLAHGDASVRPMGMAEGADGHVFVTAGRAGAVLEVDPKSGVVVRRIDAVGARPWGIARVPTGDLLVTANGPSGDVSVIERISGRVRARIKIGVGPWGATAASRQP